MPWKDVTTSDKFRELSEQDRALVKRRYFERKLLPSIQSKTNDPEMVDTAFQRFMSRPDDTGEGALRSATSAFARGALRPLSDIPIAVGALTGSEGIEEFGKGIQSGIESSLPVNPAQEGFFTTELPGVAGQVASMFAGGGAGALGVKVLGGTTKAAQLGAKAAVGTQAFAGGTAGGAASADTLGLQGGERVARALLGGVTELASEAIPFGMGLETGLVRNLLGGSAEKGVAKILAGGGTEAMEEGFAETAGQATDVAFRPEQASMDLAQIGKAMLLGGAGGVLMGGINQIGRPTPPESQTPIQQSLAAETNAIPVDEVPPQTEEEKRAGMEAGNPIIVDPQGNTAAIAPEAWNEAMKRQITQVATQVATQPSEVETRLAGWMQNPGLTAAVQTADSIVTTAVDTSPDVSKAAEAALEIIQGVAETPSPAMEQPEKPSQILTGSNVQTSTEMPVPPPTAEAGAGVGEAIQPQPIETTPDATIQREIPENRVEERVQIDEGGLQATPSGGNIPVEGGQIQEEVAPKKRGRKPVLAPQVQPMLAQAAAINAGTQQAAPSTNEFVQKMTGQQPSPQGAVPTPATEGKVMPGGSAMERMIKPPKVGNVAAIPTPEEEARWKAVDDFTAPYVSSLSDEALDDFGSKVGVRRNGVADDAYRTKIIGNTHPDDLLDAIPDSISPQTATVATPTEAKQAEKPTKKKTQAGAPVLEEYPELEMRWEREVYPNGTQGGWILKESRTGARLAGAKTKDEAISAFRRNLMWQQAWNTKFDSVWKMVNDLIAREKLDAQPYTQDYTVKPTKAEWKSILEDRLSEKVEEANDLKSSRDARRWASEMVDEIRQKLAFISSYQGGRVDKAAPTTQQSPQTTASEKQTATPSIKEVAASGVASSSREGGRSIALEQESPVTTIESTEKTDIAKEAMRFLEEDLTAQQRKVWTPEMFTAAQAFFDSGGKDFDSLKQVIKFPRVVQQAYLKADKEAAAEQTRREAADAALAREVDKAAKEQANAEEAQAKREELALKTLNSLIEKTRTNVVQGAVKPADANKAIQLLNRSGEIPNVLFTWIGTSKDFLADPANQSRYPDTWKAVSANSNIEGMSENGQPIVFTDNVGVSDLDRKLANLQGTTPEVAAVRRVILHENIHKGMFFLSLKDKMKLFQFLHRLYSPEELDQLAKSYDEYADWRTNQVSYFSIIEEAMTRDFDSMVEIPRDGIWAEFMQFLRDIWQKITGKTSEPKLKDYKDVFRLIRNSLKNSEKVNADRLKNGGAVRMSISGRDSLRVKMTRKAMTEAALNQAEWKDWYEEHQETLDEFFGDHAQQFQDILSVTSQAASVKANVGLALKAFGQWHRGEDFVGFLPAVIQNLNRLRDKTQIQGQKISAYKKNNDGTVDEAVIDRHIARLVFGVDSPSKAQFEKAQQILSEVANNIGWTPRQVQAALWAHSIYKSGKTPESYGNYLKKLESKGTLIERIGRLSIGGSEGDGTSGGRGRFAPSASREGELTNIRFSKVGKGLSALFPRQSTIQDAYRAASQGQSSQFISLSNVFAKAKEANPRLTEEAFKADVMRLYDSGAIYLEGANSTQEAEAASLSIPGTSVGTAVRLAVPQPMASKVFNAGLSSIPYEPQSGTTQVATTVGSYQKAANMLLSDKSPNIRVLDYGAGLGLGSDAMREEIANVDSFEVNPERWKGSQPPTFTDSSQIAEKYDGIVNLNVLNVVPKNIRDAIVDHIGSLLNDGGRAIIGVRKWSGDVDRASGEAGAEPKSIVIKKKQGDTFQKGFDGNELVDYLKERLGDGFLVVKANIAANGAIVTKLPSQAKASKVEYDSPNEAAFNSGAEVARNTNYDERDKAVRSAIRAAYDLAPKPNGPSVPLDQLYDLAKQSMPDLTEDEFSQILQDLYEDSGALLQSGNAIVSDSTPTATELKDKLRQAIDADDEAMAKSLVPKDVTVIRLLETQDLDEDGNPTEYFILSNGSPESVAERLSGSDASYRLYESSEEITDRDIRSWLFDGLFEGIVPKKDFGGITIHRQTVESKGGDFILPRTTPKQFNVTTPDGQRAGYAIIVSSLPTGTMASTIDPEGDASKKFVKGIEDIESGTLKAAFAGRQFTDFKPIDRTIKPAKSYQETAINYVNNLVKEGASLEQIANSVVSPAFLESIGIEKDLMAQDALGIEVRSRVNNAYRSEKNPTKKRLLEKLDQRMSAFWQGVGSKKGAHLGQRSYLISTPRYSWMFLRDEVEREMKKRRDNILIAQFGENNATDFTQNSYGNADKANQMAADENVNTAESTQEFDQDAADLAAGEATLTGAFLKLYEELKDLIRKNGIIARAKASRVAKSAMASISDAERDAIMSMSDAELDAIESKNNKRIEEILNTLLGKESAADTPEKKTVRKKRERMVEVAKKRADKGLTLESLDSDSALSKMLREINQARRGAEVPLKNPIPWRKLLSQKASTVEEYRQRIFDAISANEELKSATTEQKARLADLFAEAWESKRKSILDSMQERLIREQEAKGNLSKKAAEALQEKRMKMVEDINLGIFDNDELAKIMAEKFGIKSEFTDAEREKIESLIDILQDETLNRVKRNKAAYELLETLSAQTDIPIAKLLANFWVSSVLSGMNTVTSIGLSVLSGMGELTTVFSRILETSLKNRKRLPSEVAAAFKTLARLLSAFPRQANRAWQYLVTGDQAFLDPSMNDALKNMNWDSIGKSNQLAEQMAKSDKIIEKVMGLFMRTVSRLLTALDLFNSGLTKEGSLSIVFRQLDLDPAKVEMLEKKSDLKAYRAKVIQDYFGGVEPKTLNEKALVNSYAAADMMKALDELGNVSENADQMAMQGAMTLDPSGIGGYGYRAVKSLMKSAETGADKLLERNLRKWDEAKNTGETTEAGVKLALSYLFQFAAYNAANLVGVRFARFAGNKFNQSLSFLPVLGALRLYEAEFDPERIRGKEAFTDMIKRNQLTGVVAAVFGYYALKAIADEPDDEERGWFINGGWNNLTPEKKQQKLAAGEKEYTIGFGGKVFNYGNWPGSGIIAAIGSLSDLIRFSPEQWSEKTVPSRLLSATASGVFSATDVPALSQFQELFGSSLSSKDPNEQKLTKFARVLANYAGGFMPRILKDLDYLADPNLRKYETLWEKTASHIPIYRRYEGKEYYDILGKQIQRNIYPGSREFMVKPTDPAYKILGALNSRGIWLTPANAEHRMVGKGARRRKLTQEEADNYGLETGKGYEKMLLRYGQRALQMPTERARDFLLEKADDVRDKALKKVYRGYTPAS